MRPRSRRWTCSWCRRWRSGCAAEIAGDHDSAARVELVLPETGVCNLSAGLQEGNGCCSGPAPAESGCVLRVGCGRKTGRQDRLRMPVIRRLREAMGGYAASAACTDAGVDSVDADKCTDRKCTEQAQAARERDRASGAAHRE
jgi:hypothetical protein